MENINVEFSNDPHMNRLISINEELDKLNNINLNFMSIDEMLEKTKMLNEKLALLISIRRNLIIKSILIK